MGGHLPPVEHGPLRKGGRILRVQPRHPPEACVRLERSGQPGGRLWFGPPESPVPLIRLLAWYVYLYVSLWPVENIYIIIDNWCFNPYYLQCVNELQIYIVENKLFHSHSWSVHDQLFSQSIPYLYNTVQPIRNCLQTQQTNCVKLRKCSVYTFKIWFINHLLSAHILGLKAMLLTNKLTIKTNFIFVSNIHRTSPTLTWVYTFYEYEKV
jgi:hypothetical protein